MAPSDSNGVYSLPDGSEAVTGEVIQAATHNTPVQDMASAMSARLMRSGVAPMTGSLKIVDGSVGSPAIKFNTDGTSGIYKTTNGIGVSVGGTKVAEFTSSGVSRMIGELVPWTRLTAPDGWVLPYGQTLSRTTYAELWEIAQTEIAAGNTFFTNGDGSTTFGIGDLRGRVVAGKDNMGGTSANRLTGSSPGVNGAVLGATGGDQTQVLVQSQLPAVRPSFTGNSGTVNVTTVRSDLVFGTVAVASGGDAGAVGVITAASRENNAANSTGSFTPTGTVGLLGSGASHNNVQPTMACNYILYVGA